MKFTLEIELGNDAMQTSEDIADSLRDVARKLDRSEPPKTLAHMGGVPIRDTNGNTVGFWAVDMDEEMARG